MIWVLALAVIAQSAVDLRQPARTSPPDLECTVAGQTLTVAPGTVGFVVNGLPASYTFARSTIAAVGGADTGVILIFVDYNAGAPVLRCLMNSGLNPADYAVSQEFSGATCEHGTAFPAGSVTVAEIDVSSGQLQRPRDYRTFLRGM